MRPYGFMPSGRFSVFMGQLRVILARSPAPVPFPAGFVSVTCQPTTETEVYMDIINLRDYYPFYTSDCFMEVSELRRSFRGRTDARRARCPPTVKRRFPSQR